MTTTYDPFHPAYLDEADLRQELDRVYDLCHGCRLCFKFCTSFPTLFDIIDGFDDQDAARMTPAQQDQVVDECFGCKLCYINCPYVPGQSEWELDFPRLMMRADQVRAAQRSRPTLQARALGQTDRVGRLNTALAPVANKVVTKPGSAGRKLMEKVAGIAAERVLPPYARQRFSTWFKKRPAAVTPVEGATRDPAIVFPTCLVEYQAPEVGRALVGVYERNGIECSLPEGQVCCGAPWLHQGYLDQFRDLAEKNVTVLAGAIREAQARGEEPVVVVPQPTCGYILKQDYADYLATDDARLVAEHTRDACEHLMVVHKEGGGLDTGFAGETPETVTYHAPCHLRAQNVGLKSRDLLKLTGAKVTVVAECSAIDGTWGYREQNYEISRKVAKKLATAIEKADDDLVAGDCHLANGGIVQETGKAPVHPLQVLAAGYELPEEETSWQPR